MLLPKSASVLRTATWDDSSEFDVDKIISGDGPTTIWRDYYMRGSSGRSYHACNTQVILGSYAKVIEPKENWQPGNVRSFGNPTVGVWHPDRLKPILYWNGGRCSIDQRDPIYFNPFTLMPADVLVRTFTEHLPDADKVYKSAAEKNGLYQARHS